MKKSKTFYNIAEEGFREKEAFKAEFVFAPVALTECYIQKETAQFHGVGIGLFAPKMETSKSYWKDILPEGFRGEGFLTQEEAAEAAKNWEGKWEVQKFPVLERYWTHGAMSSPKMGKIVLWF